jgi:cellobiose phosphorylase
MESKNYGYFDQDGREYVVTDAKTPLPFVNYF